MNWRQQASRLILEAAAELRDAGAPSLGDALRELRNEAETILRVQADPDHKNLGQALIDRGPDASRP